MPILFFDLKDNLLGGNSLLFAETNDLNQNNDINSAFDDSNDSYFPNSPLELMNVLRSIESMSDSTPPSDAIDDALKAFEREDNADNSVKSNIR